MKRVRQFLFVTVPLFAVPLTWMACGGGGGGGGPAPVQDCDANFTLVFPDGSTTTIDGCARTTLEATFEFDPDDRPEFRTQTLRFDGTPEEGFDCSLTIEQTGLCGPGYYSIGNGSSVSVTTFDCTDTADLYEGTYAASSGSVHLTAIDGGQEVGNFTNQALAVSIVGEVSVQLSEGLSLSGSFSVATQVTADDAEEQDCLMDDPPVGDDDDTVDDDDTHDPHDDDDGVDDDDTGGTDSDGDGDGWTTQEGDCNDSDPLIHPGAQELCDGIDNDCDCPSAICGPGDAGVDENFDIDGDGFIGVTPFCVDIYGSGGIGEDAADCDDTDPSIFPGALEGCDEYDSNCNGSLVDQYPDSDGDGVPDCIDEEEEDDDP